LLEINYIMEMARIGRTLFGVRGKGGGSVTNWVKSVDP
jgi:hypothetical protein